jgi:hypothetical protein
LWIEQGTLKADVYPHPIEHKPKAKQGALSNAAHELQEHRPSLQVLIEYLLLRHQTAIKPSYHSAEPSYNRRKNQ